ncbi:MAG: hypothetical protein V3V99_08235 [candidate division Zixibacteria bacterium]
MDYGKIIATGFKQAWKYKSLWIFGLFVSGGGSGYFNLSDKFERGDIGNWGRWDRFGDFDLRNFDFDNPLFILALAGIVLLLVLVFWVLGTISIGGLIGAARDIKSNMEYRFSNALSTGLKKFFPLFGLSLLALIIGGAFVFILIMIGVGTFIIHVGLGLLSLAILIPLLIVGIFIIGVTAALTERMIVIENKQVFDSIGDSFALWKSHLGPSILYALIYLGISIAIGITAMIIVIFMVLPFIAVGFVNWLLAVLIGVPTVLIILLVISGFTGSATHLMTTEWYYQLKGLSQAVAAIQVNAPAPPQTSSTPPPPSTDDNPPPPPPPPETTPPPENG